MRDHPWQIDWNVPPTFWSDATRVYAVRDVAAIIHANNRMHALWQDIAGIIESPLNDAAFGAPQMSESMQKAYIDFGRQLDALDAKLRQLVAAIKGAAHQAVAEGKLDRNKLAGTGLEGPIVAIIVVGIAAILIGYLAVNFYSTYRATLQDEVAAESNEAMLRDYRDAWTAWARRYSAQTGQAPPAPPLTPPPQKRSAFAQGVSALALLAAVVGGLWIVGKFRRSRAA